MLKYLALLLFIAFAIPCSAQNAPSPAKVPAHLDACTASVRSLVAESVSDACNCKDIEKIDPTFLSLKAGEAELCAVLLDVTFDSNARRDEALLSGKLWRRVAFLRGEELAERAANNEDLEMLLKKTVDSVNSLASKNEGQQQAIKWLEDAYNDAVSKNSRLAALAQDALDQNRNLLAYMQGLNSGIQQSQQVSAWRSFLGNFAQSFSQIQAAQTVAPQPQAIICNGHTIYNGSLSSATSVSCQ